MPARETVFAVEATPFKFGAGAVADVGWEAHRLGMRRALLLADPALATFGIPDRVEALLRDTGVETVRYEDIRVEPTDQSMEDAAAFARQHPYDGVVALGGGSTIDHAKMANLLATHGGEVLDYVNPPIGAGRKPPAAAPRLRRSPCSTCLRSRSRPASRTDCSARPSP